MSYLEGVCHTGTDCLIRVFQSCESELIFCRFDFDLLLTLITNHHCVTFNIFYSNLCIILSYLDNVHAYLKLSVLIQITCDFFAFMHLSS